LYFRGGGTGNYTSASIGHLPPTTVDVLTDTLDQRHVHYPYDERIAMPSGPVITNDRGIRVIEAAENDYKRVAETSDCCVLSFDYLWTRLNDLVEHLDYERIEGTMCGIAGNYPGCRSHVQAAMNRIMDAGNLTAIQRHAILFIRQQRADMAAGNAPTAELIEVDDNDSIDN
jgi:hypothetical protein